MTDDEIITAALLLGAEFVLSTSKHTRLWYCKSPDLHTGLYVTKKDAAAGYLRKRGYQLDFYGNLQEA